MADQQTPAPWRRAVGYFAWRWLTAALLVLVVGWDGATLTMFPSAYSSDAYALLRLAPWGMATYGPPLLALFLVTGYAYSRHRGGTGRTYIVLRICLGTVAVWYAGWTAAIVGAWITTGRVSSLGVGKLLFIAVVCVVLARLTPTSLPPGKR